MHQAAAIIARRQGPIQVSDDTKRASVRDLINAFAFYTLHPTGKLRVDWCSTWNFQEFRRWFRKCLATKMEREKPPKGRKHSAEYQSDLRWDANQIADYTQRRIRHTGCHGLLRTLEMRLRYPHINRQTED